MRHNKWSDGAIREALLMVREATKERDTLIALSDPPLVFVYELIKHRSAAAGESSPSVPPHSTTMTFNGYCRAFTARSIT